MKRRFVPRSIAIALFAFLALALSHCSMPYRMFR